jgi:hypothetical protein
MHMALWSDALKGIEDVPDDVFADGDRARVVEPESSRCLRA